MKFLRSSVAALSLLLVSTVGLSAGITTVESARSHTAAGVFGCTVNAASVATPSVIGCTAAHNLIDGDQVQIINVGGTTTVNTTGYAKVTGQSTSTFALYSDAALTTGVTGTGSYTSGGTVSQAVDISGFTGDWTLDLRIESLTASKKVLVSVEQSTDGFATFTTLAVVNVSGLVSNTYGNMIDRTFRAYTLPSSFFGTANGRVRVKIQSIDGSATAVVSLFIKT